jgi:hypothetical protein
MVLTVRRLVVASQNADHRQRRQAALPRRRLGGPVITVATALQVSDRERGRVPLVASMNEGPGVKSLAC